jgi:hypothetical protein
MNAILKSGDLELGSLTELAGQLQPVDDSATLPIRIWAEGILGWTFDIWRGLDGRLRWCAAGREPLELTGRAVLAQAESGRFFAPDGELKWRTILVDAPEGGERIKRSRVVFLGTRDWFPAFDRLALRTELDQLSPSDSSLDVILWGQQSEHSPGEWIELRIPHRFRYPVSTAQPEEESAGGDDVKGGRRHSLRSGVRVKTETWLDRFGTPHFMRLCDLVVYQIKE